MTEKPPSNIDRFDFLSPESRAQVEKISNLYKEILQQAETDIRILDQRSEILIAFHTQLKADCLELFGDSTLWIQVPAAQKLIGGTIEPRTTITDEQFLYICQRVDEAVTELEQLVNGVAE